MGTADHHLLLGLLALQNGLINQGQLMLAVQAWTLDKSKSLADHLEARGDLTDARRALLEGLAEVHLEAHGGDVEKSLAAVSAGNSTRERLTALADADVNASLTCVRSGSYPTGDADRTGTYHVGESTSEGLRFRVLRPHAKGGLGAVFVALDSELHREVALKQLLDHHADDLDSRHRFVIEAEITGGLEHPGVVPVYGLGTYGDGRPYYAMRFIKGDSLKEAIGQFHKDESLKSSPGRRSLELRKLLRRFTDVCNAIDYAHSRGVLHRDIKPGNVIVGKHGETLVVDWGLAKAVGRADPTVGEQTIAPSSASGSAETLPGQALGTPAYMSPEQARGDLAALGPRSDVYSLGATLYCLLTGKAPFEGDVGEVLQAVERGEFRPPGALDPSIDKALEAVCLKAMALKTEDRYESCKTLADDVERWNAGEPVSARRETVLEQARRWMRRRRTLVSVGAATGVVAGICMAIATVLLSDANHALARANTSERTAKLLAESQRNRAEESFRLARDAVDRYLTRVSDSKALRDAGQVDLRKQLMEEAGQFYQRFIQEHAGDPTLEADLSRARLKVGKIEGDVGDKAKAIERYNEALTSLRALLARRPDDPELTCELTDGLVALGSLHRELGKNAVAESTYREAIAAVEALVRRDHLNTKAGESLAMAHRAQGLVLRARGRYAEGLIPMEKSHDFYVRAVAADPDNRRLTNALAASYNNFSLFERDLDRPERAVDLLKRSIEIRRRLARLDPQDWGQLEYLGSSLSNLATVYEISGHHAEAEKPHLESIEILRKLTLEHPEIRALQFSLAQILTDTGRSWEVDGRLVEAKPLMVEAAEIQRRLVAGNPTVVMYGSELGRALANLTRLARDLGQQSEAENYSREALELRRTAAKTAPAVSRYGVEVIYSLRNLAQLLKTSGNMSEAESLLREAVEANKILVEKSPEVPGYEAELGRCLAQLGEVLDRPGRRHQARAAYTAALTPGRNAVARAHSPSNVNDLILTLRLHGVLERRLGNIAQGEALTREALAILTRNRIDRPDDLEVAATFAMATAELADVRLAAGAHIEALDLYGRAIATLVPIVDREKKDKKAKEQLLNLQRGRAQALSAMGRHADALEDWKRIIASEDPSHPSPITHAQHAVALARARDSAAALTEVEPLEPLPDLTAPAFREIARALTILHGRTGKPGLADRAIAMLRRSLAVPGYDLDELTPDPDLDLLRPLAEFQALLLDVAFPNDPFEP